MLFPRFRQATYTRILNGKSCILRDRINYRSFNLLLLISCYFTYIIFKSKKNISKLLKKILKLFISRKTTFSQQINQDSFICFTIPLFYRTINHSLSTQTKRTKFIYLKCFIINSFFFQYYIIFSQLNVNFCYNHQNTFETSFMYFTCCCSYSYVLANTTNNFTVHQLSADILLSQYQ